MMVMMVMTVMMVMMMRMTMMNHESCMMIDVQVVYVSHPPTFDMPTLETYPRGPFSRIFCFLPILFDPPKKSVGFL